VQTGSPSLVDGLEPFLHVNPQPLQQALDHHRGNFIVGAVVAQGEGPAARAIDGNLAALALPDIAAEAIRQEVQQPPGTERPDVPGSRRSICCWPPGLDFARATARTKRQARVKENACRTGTDLDASAADLMSAAVVGSSVRTPPCSFASSSALVLALRGPICRCGRKRQ
jgi:hypothetical protein